MPTPVLWEYYYGKTMQKFTILHRIKNRTLQAQNSMYVISNFPQYNMQKIVIFCSVGNASEERYNFSCIIRTYIKVFATKF